MIEIKEESVLAGNSDENCIIVENEDSLNNNIGKEDLIIKVKREVTFNYDSDEKNLEETEAIPGVAGMTPVETATLLLLSRIALFNKVRLKLEITMKSSKQNVGGIVTPYLILHIQCLKLVFNG